MLYRLIITSVLLCHFNDLDMLTSRLNTFSPLQPLPSDPTRSTVVKWVKIFKTEKTIEIQLVRLTEVCGEVLRIDNGDLTAMWPQWAVFSDISVICYSI